MSESPGQDVELREAAYDSDLVQDLVAEVQLEYVRRYGGPDATPIDPAQFSPPTGVFLVALVAGEPVGTAGLRSLGGGVVELKRMYVRAAHRRRGHARRMLAALEDRARAAGYGRLELETGDAQPEAVAMYRAAGYLPTAPFGHYACSASSIHLGKDLLGQELLGQELLGQELLGQELLGQDAPGEDPAGGPVTVAAPGAAIAPGAPRTRRA